MGEAEASATASATPGPPDPATVAAWAPYLAPGETLLWTGRPGGGVRLRYEDIFAIPTGLAVTGGMLFAGWPLLRGDGGLLGGTVAWGFLAIGLWLSGGRLLWDAYRRARTVYALSDARAIVASRALGRRLQSYPIGPDTPAFIAGLRRDTVVFAREMRRIARTGGGLGRRGGSRMEVLIGFEFQTAPEAVLAVLQAAKFGAGVTRGEHR
ncbi:MAG: hypothetical protein ACFBSD_16125 [Paracoccaceae bacterium]